MWFIPSISLAILIQAIKFAIQNGGSLFHSLFAWCLFSSASHCNHCWGNVVSLEIAKRVGLGQFVHLPFPSKRQWDWQETACCMQVLTAASTAPCSRTFGMCPIGSFKIEIIFFFYCSSLIINFHGSSFYMPKMPL